MRMKCFQTTKRGTNSEGDIDIYLVSFRSYSYSNLYLLLVYSNEANPLRNSFVFWEIKYV